MASVSYTKKVYKIGHSKMVGLPPEFARKLNIDANTHVDVDLLPNGKGIAIRKKI